MVVVISRGVYAGGGDVKNIATTDLVGWYAPYVNPRRLDLRRSHTPAPLALPHRRPSARKPARMGGKTSLRGKHQNKGEQAKKMIMQLPHLATLPLCSRLPADTRPPRHSSDKHLFCSSAIPHDIARVIQAVHLDHPCLAPKYTRDVVYLPVYWQDTFATPEAPNLTPCLSHYSS